MYDKDIIQEDAILSWEDEKRDADESDKVFVNQAQTFIQVNITINYILNLCISTRVHIYPVICFTKFLSNEILKLSYSFGSSG